MAGTFEAIRRREHSMRVLQRVLVRVQIEDHDIAGPGGDERVHSFPIRLKQDLEVLTKGRRKKRVQRAIFRIQSDSGHSRAIFHLAEFTVPFWGIGDVTV